MTHNTRLLDAAMTLAMKCIADGEPLQPFVITEGGRGAILSIVGENAGQQLSLAQQTIDDLPADAIAWAFAYDGYLTLDDAKTDAIFIETGERSAAEVQVYAQRYLPAMDDRAVEKIGTFGRLTKMAPRLQNSRFR
jgi:hypothetical protein